MRKYNYKNTIEQIKASDDFKENTCNLLKSELENKQSKMGKERRIMTIRNRSSIYKLGASLVACLILVISIFAFSNRHTVSYEDAAAPSVQNGDSSASSEDSTAPQSIDSNDKAKIVITFSESIGSNMNTEEYSKIEESIYKGVINNPLSTFSIDVDTASYSNIRRFIMDGQLPPKDAVRIEEMINYFSYDYPNPKGDVPFSTIVEVGKAPWNEKHNLVMIGLKGKEIETDISLKNNLVFLIDTSGSMQDRDKLPLLKSSFELLVNQLNENDRVSIVTYAGSSGVVLDSVSGENKNQILDAIANLNASGSTAGSHGIELAYRIAEENLIPDGNNRVILATDGDFNVGITSDGELTRLIEEKRENGVFLSVLGFGTGNLKDTKAELLADKGNGNYSYIDSILEAKKVLVDELGGTLYTIAKDVKIQVEFNPAKVKGYRLIGYENRLLNTEDFSDDKKDAGELGAGHTVTAFYEIIPADSDEKVPGVEELKYQEKEIIGSDELLTVKLRYKEPKESESILIDYPVIFDEDKEPSNDFYFASSVVEFGFLLRDSEYKGEANYNDAIRRAKQYRGMDPNGYRSEFIKIVELAQHLSR